MADEGMVGLAEIIKFRLVRFGTTFVQMPGMRPAARLASQCSPGSDEDREASLLYENELAVDVGGVSWDDRPQTARVLDHHFVRDDGGQFPSASAAVLHRAQRIHENWQQLPDELWLVSHEQPDFDAYCAMYLARAVLAGQTPHDGWEEYGIYPDGWFGAGRDAQERRNIDWFKPQVSGLPPERRWAVLLAAVASSVDNCRRMACPKHRALHAILYAAIMRGRNYSGATGGAWEFFDEVQHALRNESLNPLFDSVLENSQRFAPELALLDREVEAYGRDLARSRRTLVFLREASADFDAWFAPLKSKPLLERAVDGPEEIQTSAGQRPGLEGPLGAVDGIYLRDPECLLFKDWARQDTENSRLGRGFLFTAVAYSGGRSGGSVNTTDYFFSLDPERTAGSAPGSWHHLYNVWARLQCEEVRALAPARLLGRSELSEGEQPSADSSACRHGFEQRAVGFDSFFADPWFDGSNYRCTIIATPHQGTIIAGSGTRADLLDDPVVQLVREEIELSIFESDVKRIDLSSNDREPDRRPEFFPFRELDRQPRETFPGFFRFCQVSVHADVPLLDRAVAEQLGRALWRVLESDQGSTVPADFLERHLMAAPNWVGVWSRRGIALAFRPVATDKVAHVEKLFRELVALTRAADALMARGMNSEDSSILHQGHDLSRRIARLRHELALPEQRLWSRFFEASRLADVLASVHDVNMAAAHAAHMQKIEQLEKASGKSLEESQKLQANLEWVEIFLIGVYTAEFVELLGRAVPIEEFSLGILSTATSLIMALAFFLALRPDTNSHIKGRPLILGFALIVALFIATSIRFSEMSPVKRIEEKLGGVEKQLEQVVKEMQKPRGN